MQGGGIACRPRYFKVPDLVADTVVIAEDETLFRDFLRQTIEGKLGLTVVGEAGDGAYAEKLCMEKRPELLVADLRLPGMQGEELCRRLLRMMPDLKIVVVSAIDTPQVGLELLGGGVRGFVHKRERLEVLEQAVEAVLDDRVFMCFPIFEPQCGGENAREKERLAQLTDREREVLTGVASGKTTKLIASELNLSVKTVEAHRTSISKKLHINDIAGLTLFAVRVGLLQM